MDGLVERVAALERANGLMERRLRHWRRLAGVLLLVLSAGGGALIAGEGSWATAQTRTGAPGPSTLSARVASLEAAVAELKSVAQSWKRSAKGSTDAVRNACGAEATARRQALQELQGRLDAEVAARQKADEEAGAATTAAAAAQAALREQLGPLAEKLAHFSIESIDGCYSVVLTGANFHLRNGLGATNGNLRQPFGTEAVLANGLGNLILGYNESRALVGGGTDLRTGSHNLVLGQGQNFSSVGGLVAGQINQVTGANAAITGGQWNSASGACASVSGGSRSSAGGACAVVCGGDMNNAAGRATVVGGGRLNSASGEAAAVTGGANRGAAAPNSWAAGGLFQSN